MRRGALLVIAMLVAAVLAAADNKTSELKFTVLKDENGKPVRNAAVVLHPVEKDGKQGKGGFELKTDPEGQASFPAAPYGKLRVQVLARGYQTFGEDYDINQPQHEIVIKLKKPQGQYSIYEKKPDEKPKEKQ
jgi:Carboxypeptidase regulatory-like domain